MMEDGIRKGREEEGRGGGRRRWNTALITVPAEYRRMRVNAVDERDWVRE